MTVATGTLGNYQQAGGCWGHLVMELEDWTHSLAQQSLQCTFEVQRESHISLVFPKFPQQILKYQDIMKNIGLWCWRLVAENILTFLDGIDSPPHPEFHDRSRFPSRVSSCC